MSYVVTMATAKMPDECFVLMPGPMVGPLDGRPPSDHRDAVRVIRPALSADSPPARLGGDRY